jgi:hypothetical protein
MAFPISHKDFSCKLPMSTLDQDDVRVAIAIQVADAGVGRGLGDGFQGNDFKDTAAKQSRTMANPAATESALRRCMSQYYRVTAPNCSRSWADYLPLVECRRRCRARAALVRVADDPLATQYAADPAPCSLLHPGGRKIPCEISVESFRWEAGVAAAKVDPSNPPRLPAPLPGSAEADGSIGWIVRALRRSRHSARGTSAGSEPPRQGTAGGPHRLTRPQPSALR